MKEHRNRERTTAVRLAKCSVSAAYTFTPSNYKFLVAVEMVDQHIFSRHSPCKMRSDERRLQW